jgi:Fe-S-cluster containining protein
MANSEHLTASGVLSVSDRKVEFEISVPAGPTVAKQLLPMLRSLADAIVDVAVDAASDQGESVSCRKGCGACCRQLVPISEIEAHHLAELVSALPEPRRNEIIGRFKQAREHLQRAGVLEKLLAAEPLAIEERATLGMEYFRQGIACPFLEEESCSIHTDRPIACREYLVTSPAKNCADPSPETVKCVKVSKKVSKALRSFNAANDANAGRWVPLILALEWAGEHPDAETPRPGAELLRELFSRLTGQEVPSPDGSECSS